MLPGADLLDKGLADLQAGIESVESVLLQIGRPRLERLGVDVPQHAGSPERRLYELLADEDPDAAHGRYNALVRRLVSYERAAECAGRRR